MSNTKFDKLRKNLSVSGALILIVVVVAYLVFVELPVAKVDPSSAEVRQMVAYLVGGLGVFFLLASFAISVIAGMSEAKTGQMKTTTNNDTEKTNGTGGVA